MKISKKCARSHKIRTKKSRNENEPKRKKNEIRATSRII